MSAAIYGNWSLFVVLGAAVFTRGVAEYGKRALDAGPPALTGLGMFIISSLLMNAWMAADLLEDQLFLWRYGILTDALLYLAIYTWFSSRRTAIYVVPLILALHFIAISDASIGAKQIAEAAQMGIIALLCAMCFYSINKTDIIGILFWGVLTINEAIAALFYYNCQFALFGIREAGSSCVQLYSFDPTAWALMVSTLFCAWFGFRWCRPR